jgi:hypothetical protein
MVVRIELQILEKLMALFVAPTMIASVPEMKQGPLNEPDACVVVPGKWPSPL